MSDVEYLEYELERYRETEERQQAEWMRERKRKQAEQRVEIEASYRRASNWREALRQQAFLCQREANLYDDEDDPDQFFSESAKACERALELWTEMAGIRQGDIERLQTKIEQLQGQIEVIEKEIQVEVGKRLSEERNTTGWRSIATSLQEEDDYEAWLDW